MEEHIDTEPEVHERPERWSVMCHVPVSYIHTEIYLVHNSLSGIITQQGWSAITAGARHAGGAREDRHDAHGGPLRAHRLHTRIRRGSTASATRHLRIALAGQGRVSFRGRPRSIGSHAASDAASTIQSRPSLRPAMRPAARSCVMRLRDTPRSSAASVVVSHIATYQPAPTPMMPMPSP